MSHAEDLVRRLLATQQRRHELHQVKDRAGELTAADLATSLCSDVPWAVLRDALLHATNPASVPPIPVVLGPQDVAAVVSRDELLALVHVYATAYIGWGRGDQAADQRCEQAYRDVYAAVERLCQAVPVFEAYGDGRTS